MTLLAFDFAPVSAPVLGTCTVAGRVVEVVHHGDHTLWLNVTVETTSRSLGVIRWDDAHTPRLTIAASEIAWVQSGSRRAEQLVTAVMSVYRAAKGLPDTREPAKGVPEPIPESSARHAYVGDVPFVVFDVVPRKCKPSPRRPTARGVATVPQLREGDQP